VFKKKRKGVLLTMLPSMAPSTSPKEVSLEGHRWEAEEPGYWMRKGLRKDFCFVACRTEWILS